MTDDLGPGAEPFFEANEGWGAAALSGTRWVLTALDEGPVAFERPPTLEVGTEGEIAGLAGCNRYRGRAILGEGTLSVGPLSVTRVLCPAPVMALESAYLAALESVSTWRRDATSLELSGEDGIVRLLYRQSTEGDLG
jgi:heat shock protein HslJ